MKRKGFTLIELLVVVAIISVLMGLLLPAVQMVRASARRTACANNMSQLGLGAIHYELNRGSLPGYQNPMRQNNGNALTVRWPVIMLPEIEHTDIYDYIKDQPTTFIPQTPKVNIFKCPSSNSFEHQAMIDYAINGGSGTEDVGANGIQWKGDGLGLDRVGKANSHKPASISLDFVSSGDGTSNTILFGERTNAAVRPLYVDNQAMVPSAGFVWTPITDKFPVAFIHPRDIHAGVTIVGDSSDYKYRFPNGSHGDTMVMCFADGSVRMVRSDLTEAIYSQLMTSHSRFTSPRVTAFNLPLLSEGDF